MSLRNLSKAMIIILSGNLNAYSTPWKEADFETNTRRVAYVEINNNNIDSVGLYQKDGKPVFDIAIMFAANIRGTEGKADLYFNPQYDRQLHENKSQIEELQKQGVKVLMSVLNDHRDAGWSCFRNYEDAEEFALELKASVENYGLDGIEIDDEYDKCKQKFKNSLAMVTTAIKRVMPDKLLVKSLWSDLVYFQADYEGHTLGQNLDMGWEMSYWAPCEVRAAPYLAYMDRSKIGVGASTSMNNKETAQSVHRCVVEGGYGGGFMVFNLGRKHFEWLDTAMSLD